MSRRKITKKQEETVEGMKERRAKDCTNLREDIESKLKWANLEKAKGLATIEKQIAQIKENKDTLLKLEGAILVLTQLLEAKQKEEPKKEE